MNRLILRVLTLLGVLGLLGGAADAAPWGRTRRAALFQQVPAARVQADTDGNRLYDNLEAKLTALSANASVEVVVRFKAGRESAAAQIGSRVRRRLALDRSVSARLSAGEIRRLVASGAVESIEENGLCYAARDTSQASFGVTKARADFGLTGDGDGDPTSYSTRDATIAVLDTGIDSTHPAFPSGKIIAWNDFVNGRAQPYDDALDGHGTHVASIAAGAVVNGVGGVAPAASLVILKVLTANSDGSSTGRLDTIAAAVDWCIQNRQRHGIDILNLSLGGMTSSDGTDVLSRAVNRAVDAGLVVCVAAGNEGPNPLTIGAPAAAAKAITVGNMIDTEKVGPRNERGFAVWRSSSRGPTADGRTKPDLCAPGAQIVAARANSGGGSVRYTGTSMATAFVAGMAALMLQADPSLTPARIKEIMKETAVHFGPPGENNDFGAGRLDGYAALAAAVGTPGTPPPAPAHRHFAGQLSGTGASQRWEISVTDTRFPIAATLIMQDVNTDFELYLRDPSGSTVAASEGVARQETIGFKPTRTGTYTLVALSFSGAGRYYVDASFGADPPQAAGANRIAVFRPETREWFIRGGDGRATVVQFGGPGDQPVPADYFGAGTAQIAVFRPSTREWFIRIEGGLTIAFQFGGPEDVPVPADYLGLGRAQVAVFRPSTREWFIRNENGQTTAIQFGGPGDVPVPADYLRLQRAQIAVYRPSTGQWFVRNESGGTTEIPWGTVGDRPVPADYLGSGRAQVAVYRPSTSEFFLRGDDGQGAVIQFGMVGDSPVPFDYAGSGRAQIAVYRPGAGEWFLRGADGTSTRVQWGGPGDQPVPAVYSGR